MNSYDWNQIPEERLGLLAGRKVIHGATITIARFRLQKGAVIPEHSHANEQISTIESGSLRFVVGGEEIVVGAGQSLSIPPNVSHRAVAEEDSVAVDVFSPVREDWLRGDDAYLRK